MEKGAQQTLRVSDSSMINKILLTAGVMFSVHAVNAEDLTLSIEQKNMVSGFVKRVGCIKSKSLLSVSRSDRNVAILRAKATLTKNKTIKGAESVLINESSERYTSTMSTRTDGVVDYQPRNELFFSDASSGFFCVRI